MQRDARAFDPLVPVIPLLLLTSYSAALVVLTRKARAFTGAKRRSAIAFAVVVIAATSEPASGSERANAAICSPAATAGRYRSRSASSPKSVIGPDPRPCIANAKSASASW